MTTRQTGLSVPGPAAAGHAGVPVTPRGVRTSVGPRWARLRTGAGGTRGSTGAGPFTLYKSLNSNHRAFSHPTRPTRQRSARAKWFWLTVLALKHGWRWEH
jgi:hypothetical protein